MDDLTAKIISNSPLSVLLNAVYNDDAEKTTLVLDTGISPDIRNDQGGTALLLAIKNNKKHPKQEINEHLELLQLLIDRGADVNAKNMFGETPLHWAATRGFLGVIRLLLDNGADINALNNKGETPLILAAQEWETGAAQMLIDRGARQGIRDAAGLTAADWASRREHSPMAALFNRLAAERRADNQKRLHEGASRLSFRKGPQP